MSFAVAGEALAGGEAAAAGRGAAAAKGGSKAKGIGEAAQAGLSKRTERATAGRPYYARGRGRGRRGSASVSRLAVVTILVLFASGLVRHLLVDKEPPSRKWWVGNVFAAFFLSLMADIAPNKVTRYFFYAVMMGAMFRNMAPIVDAYTKGQFDEPSGTDGTGGTGSPGAPTVPASVEDGTVGSPGGNLVPVFLRGANQPAAPAPARRATTRRRRRTVTA